MRHDRIGSGEKRDTACSPGERLMTRGQFLPCHHIPGKNSKESENFTFQPGLSYCNKAIICQGRRI